MYKLLIVDDENEILNGLCNYYPWHELARRVHELAPQCKVVFLSGYSDFEYAQQAMGYGCALLHFKAHTL